MINGQHRRNNGNWCGGSGYIGYAVIINIIIIIGRILSKRSSHIYRRNSDLWKKWRIFLADVGQNVQVQCHTQANQVLVWDDFSEVFRSDIWRKWCASEWTNGSGNLRSSYPNVGFGSDKFVVNYFRDFHPLIIILFAILTVDGAY